MNNIVSSIKKNQKSFSMYLILLLIFVAFGFMTNFTNFRERNITNILIQNSYVFILAMGMVLVIITGNIDLSVGSVVAFTGAIGAMTYNLTQSIFFSFLGAIISGIIIGAFQGFWIAYLKVPAFIVTLAGMLGLRGLTMVITNIKPIGLIDDRFKSITSGYVKPEFMEMGTFTIIVGILFIGIVIYIDLIAYKKKIKQGLEHLPLVLLILKNIVISALIFWLFNKFSSYKGIPVVVLIVAIIAIIFLFVTKNTIFGRNIYAVGGNSKAAKLSGINSEKTVFYVYIIMGAMAAIAGVIYTAYMNQALASAGNMFELDAISSVFIGGGSATGGIGTIGGSVIGALVMGVINNGMILMSLGAEYQYIVKALVLLLAVWYDLFSNKKSL